MKPKKRHINTLTFWVHSITEEQVGGVTVFNTVLRHWSGRIDDTLTIRGRPWKVGTKVDFREIVK